MNQGDTRADRITFRSNVLPGVCNKEHNVSKEMK